MRPSDPYAGLRTSLNESYEWPASYMFKWVVPVAVVSQVESLLSGAEISRRPSKNGRYVGITATLTVASADAVIELYQRVGQIDGVLSL